MARCDASYRLPAFGAPALANTAGNTFSVEWLARLHAKERGQRRRDVYGSARGRHTVCGTTPAPQNAIGTFTDVVAHGPVLGAQLA